MNRNEIEFAMDRIFDGAARVRAKKYETRVHKNVYRRFSSRVISQMWPDEKRSLKAA